MRAFPKLAVLLSLSAGWNWAAEPGRLIPVRWPGGPVEVARRAASKALPPELAAALRRWYEPWSLDLLRGTPVNCLLITWDNGGDAGTDLEQRRIVREYTVEAHKRGIKVMALASAPGSPAGIAAAVADARLDGLVLEGEFPDSARGAAAKRIYTATAPGIRIFSEGGAVQATPTSEPWIDSNLWLVRSLDFHSPEPVWLGYKVESASDEDYTRAIADAAAAGGQWVLTPDDTLLAGLAGGTPEAARRWRRITSTLRFFEEHAAWRSFSPSGALGILWEDSATGQENLNLIARRKIPYRLLEHAALARSDLTAFRAVLAIGCGLSETERAALRKFAGDGGLAIVGPPWGAAVAPDQDFEVRPLGQGRVAVYRESEPDPESLSKDVLHLIGKENLGVRLFHALTVLPAVSQSRDGQLLIQMVNYATETAEEVTIRVAGDYRAARLYGPDTAPLALELEKSARGVQVKVPRVAVYAALILEK